MAIPAQTSIKDECVANESPRLPAVVGKMFLSAILAAPLAMMLFPEMHKASKKAAPQRNSPAQRLQAVDAAMVPFAVNKSS
jgi:hypothetical protein